MLSGSSATKGDADAIRRRLVDKAYLVSHLQRRVICSHLRFVFTSRRCCRTAVRLNTPVFYFVRAMQLLISDTKKASISPFFHTQGTQQHSAIPSISILLRRQDAGISGGRWRLILIFQVHLWGLKVEFYFDKVSLKFLNKLSTDTQISVIAYVSSSNFILVKNMVLEKIRNFV